MENQTKVRGWGEIVLILLGVALGIGLLLGLIGTVLHLSPSFTVGGIGGGVGVVAAMLISQRRAASEQKKD